MTETVIACFQAMAENNRWANFRLYRACIELGADGCAAPGTNFFPSIAETLNHILQVDRYYLDALEEGGLGRSVYAGVEHIREPTALADAQVVEDTRLIAFCDGLTPEVLPRRVKTERRDGMAEERIDSLLMHLFQHQVHHRGQVHAMLAGTSVAPPQLDDFFLEHGRADDLGEALGRSAAWTP